MKQPLGRWVHLATCPEVLKGLAFINLLACLDSKSIPTKSAHNMVGFGMSPSANPSQLTQDLGMTRAQKGTRWIDSKGNHSFLCKQMLRYTLLPQYCLPPFLISLCRGCRDPPGFLPTWLGNGLGFCFFGKGEEGLGLGSCDRIPSRMRLVQVFL